MSCRLSRVVSMARKQTAPRQSQSGDGSPHSKGPSTLPIPAAITPAPAATITAGCDRRGRQRARRKAARTASGRKNAARLRLRIEEHLPGKIPHLVPEPMIQRNAKAHLPPPADRRRQLGRQRSPARSACRAPGGTSSSPACGRPTRPRDDRETAAGIPAQRPSRPYRPWSSSRRADRSRGRPGSPRSRHRGRAQRSRACGKELQRVGIRQPGEMLLAI